MRGFRKVIWSPVEEEYLKEHPDESENQLTIQLAKSRTAIRNKRAEQAGKPIKSSITAGRRSYIGKRPDCDNLFFRSRWEANCYRYLKQRKDVAKIEYEPEDFTFWQFGHKKGTVSYTPDFRVTFKDGSYIWIEVKGGLLSQTDMTKIRRFKKYFPEEGAKLVAITPGKTTRTARFFVGENVKIRWYYPELNKKWQKKITGWE